MMKILMVCLGNICRSPIAEVVLQSEIDSRGLKLKVQSAGTNRYHKGGPADERAIRVCKKRGINLSNHVARRFKTSDFDEFDLIYIMAPDVREEMAQFVTHESQWHKVKYFRNDHPSKTVPDPWYGDESDFDECFDLISSICSQMADGLK